jgi:hypothetical protein
LDTEPQLVVLLSRLQKTLVDSRIVIQEAVESMVRVTTILYLFCVSVVLSHQNRNLPQRACKRLCNYYNDVSRHPTIIDQQKAFRVTKEFKAAQETISPSATMENGMEEEERERIGRLWFEGCLLRFENAVVVVDTFTEQRTKKPLVLEKTLGIRPTHV